MLKFILKAVLLFNSFSVCEPYVMSCVAIQKPILKNNNNQLKQINMLELDSNSLLCKCSNLLNHDQSELLVKKMSSIFPQMDSISHFVLNTNSQLVTSVLENEYLKVETKKFLVLMIIQFTQMGDSTGSHILDFYYDIVQCLL
tara:strand:- start:2378 stop:2806 length:429 start_codon:yes stop_codon:yes gene_type:complete